MKHTYLLLLALLIISCRSPKRFRTASYDELSPQHRKIAILPIIFEEKKYKKNISDEDKYALLVQENDIVQSTFYQRLLRETGVGRRDIKISIQPISTTNHTLQENNIDILHLEDIPDATLAAALDVDAFLKVTIITPIMLHSTTYDIPKEILNKSSILIDNPILSQIKHFNAVQVFLQAELIDSRQLEPIWAYTRRRDLEVHDKNTELLAWLSSDIAKNFPYR